MSEGTFYKMTDAELSAVRTGIEQTLLRKGKPDQKARGIAPKYSDDNTLNFLASCTLEMKNRLYPTLDNFDVIDAIINYGDGMTIEDKGLNNIAYRILTRWHDDHELEMPSFIDGIPNNEKKLSLMMAKYATEDNPKGMPKPSLMAGYCRVVPSDKQRRKQATQPAPPEPEPNWFGWWLMMNHGHPFTKIWTIDDVEPANPYRGLVGLDMSGLRIDLPEPEPEPPAMAVYCGPLPPEVYEYRRSLRGRALLAEFRKAGYKSATAGRALIKAVGGQNIHLYGKQGTGKSNTPKDIAEFLGLPRVVIGFNSMAELVIGYLDVNGNQVWTPFLKAITSPCILQFDENDRQTDEVQDALLGILSDGYMTLADGTCIQRHPMCYLIATGNHPLQYPHTREAYGDRFRQIEVVYESEIARDIAKKGGDLGMELVEFLEDFERQRVAQAIDGAQVSYRPLVRMLADLMSDDGDTIQQIIAENLIQGALDAEQCRRIGMNMRVHNKFTDALMRM